MQIIEGKSFKDLTTFRIGGVIKYLAEVKDRNELEEAVSYAKKNNLKIFTIGGGSDFLASDNNFEGLVIKYVGDTIQLTDNVVTAEAGLSWDDLVKFTVEHELGGMESLSGIPGTVGGAPIQNIGAYGQEISDTFLKLTAYDIENEKFVTFEKDECEFAYRESIFKKKSHWQKYIITDVSFKLSKNAKPEKIYESLKSLVNENSTIKEIREAVLKTRNEKLENPNEFGNAGSFFKNPIITKEQKENLEKNYPDVKVFPFENQFKTSAAWLIENSGWKGKSFEGAAVSSKHALILINKGSATAKDMLDLSEKIINDVNDKFGIKLEREVQLINF